MSKFKLVHPFVWALLLVVACLAIGFVWGHQTAQAPAPPSTNNMTLPETIPPQNTPSPGQEKTLEECLYNASNNEANDLIQKQAREDCQRRFAE